MVRIHPIVYQQPIEKLTNEFIRSQSEPAYFDRGQRYFNQGRADLLSIKTVKDFPGYTIQSLCHGRGDALYSQEIEIRFGDKRIQGIDGYCSCPVYGNCKHVVAAVLTARQRINEKLARQFNPDLHFMDWLVAHDDEENQLSTYEQILFLLKEQNGQLMVNIETAMPVAPREWKQARVRLPGSQFNQLHMPDYLSQEDTDILLLLQTCHQLAPQSQLDIPLNGSAGFLALKLMIASGRVFWKRHHEKYIQLQDAQQLSLNTWISCLISTGNRTRSNLPD